MAKKGMKNILNTSQSDVVLEYTGSLQFDRELYFWDIIGSLAHVDSLLDAKVLSKDEHKKIKKGLIDVLKALNKGEALLRPELEDIHMNIESLLTEKIGPVAGKLHTGRSRNDQVALDARLYSRERIIDVLEEIVELQKTILDVAKKNSKTILPGLTHMQPAQPVTLAHHMMAYWFKLRRDFDRLVECYMRLNYCPLGAGAIAGNTYPIDRFKVAKALGFKAPTCNSMDTVSDRDFVAETIFCLAMVQIHLSSMAEELIIWSNPQFGYVTLSKQYTTGSSMMPQKRNPDVAELARGKTGRVAGDLVSLLTMMKGLPLAYNRDLQEDKEPLFDAFDSVVDSLWAIRSLVGTAKYDAAKMKAACSVANITATDLADYLVSKGEPFRSAYLKVKQMVQDASNGATPMEKWPVEKFKKYSKLFGKDVLDYLKPEKAVARRKIYGGTAPEAVAKELATASDMLDKEKLILDTVYEDIEGAITRLIWQGANPSR